MGSGGREQPVLGWALWALKQKAPPALVTLSLALGTGFALAVCLPGARGRGTQVTGDAVTRLAFVTDDGSRIYGTQRKHKKTTCLGSRHSLLFHRKKNNDSDTGNTLKSLNGLVTVVVFTPRRSGCSVFTV